MKKIKLERLIEALTKVVALTTAILGVLKVISEFKKPNYRKEGEE